MERLIIIKNKIKYAKDLSLNNDFNDYIKNWNNIKYKETFIYNPIIQMTSLFDKLFIKRFCLPINSDINLYEDGNKNINSCLCGHYNHVSCVLQGEGRFEEG